MTLYGSRGRDRRETDLAQKGNGMRTVIEMVWHAVSGAPSAVHEIRRPHRMGRSAAARRSLSGWLGFGLVTVALALASPSAASAADNEIRIGNTIPYSGPVAAYGIIGKTIAAY